MTTTARSYTVHGGSTHVFGRVLCSARNHHWIIDGPEQNGCPGEEVTPVEAFLASVASCGVELVQVIAREENLSVPDVEISISGTVDRGNPVRTDLTVFNEVRLEFTIGGVPLTAAQDLVERFKGR